MPAAQRSAIPLKAGPYHPAGGLTSIPRGTAPHTNANNMSTQACHQVVFRAHRKQLAFLRSRARLVALVGGAGSGKTTAGVIWSLMRAGNWPGSRGMMIARSYPQLKQSLLVELERWAQESGLDRSWRFNRQDLEVRLPNGSRFWLRSADRPESVLGADLAWLYGDEVALWSEDAFKYALSRLRQPGYAQQAAFTFTPKGRNWAFDVFGREQPDVETVRCSTRENPYLDPAFVAMLEEQYGDTAFARQEIEGEFVSFEGLVYPQFNAATQVRPLPPGAALSGVVAGVDWGYTNPGAIVVLAAVELPPPAAHADEPPLMSRNPAAALALPGQGTWEDPPWQSEDALPPRRPVLWAVDEVYARNVPPVGPGECWVSIARALRERWAIEVFYCDPAEPANIAAFTREGLPAVAGDNSVEPGIARVAALLARGQLLVAPSCPSLVEEFGRYAYEVDTEGNSKGRVVKAYDHALDALRYAVVGLQTRPAPRVFVQRI